MNWKPKKEEEDVIKVKAKCGCCGKLHTVHQFKGESTTFKIVGCDFCPSNMRYTFKEEEE
jgi:hypothetical protein